MEQEICRYAHMTYRDRSNENVRVYGVSCGTGPDEADASVQPCGLPRPLSRPRGPVSPLRRTAPRGSPTGAASEIGRLPFPNETK